VAFKLVLAVVVQVEQAVPRLGQQQQPEIVLPVRAVRELLYQLLAVR
jgi:hypothetical protein